MAPNASSGRSRRPLSAFNTSELERASRNPRAMRSISSPRSWCSSGYRVAFNSPGRPRPGQQGSAHCPGPLAEGGGDDPDLGSMGDALDQFGEGTPGRAEEHLAGFDHPAAEHDPFGIEDVGQIRQAEGDPPPE